MLKTLERIISTAKKTILPVTAGILAYIGLAACDGKSRNHSPEVLSYLLGQGKQAVLFIDDLNNNVGDRDNDTLTYEGITIPSSLTLNSNGSISGTPTAFDVGNNSLVIKATDPGNKSITETFYWFVEENYAPTIQTASLPDGTENQPYSVQLQATDPENDTLTFEKLSATLPDLFVDSDGFTHGTFYDLDVGPAEIEVSVTDTENNSDTKIFNFNVANISTLQGKVVDLYNNNSAIEGAEVWFGDNKATTLIDGTWQLENMLDGDYPVKITDGTANEADYATLTGLDNSYFIVRVNHDKENQGKLENLDFGLKPIFLCPYVRKIIMDGNEHSGDYNGIDENVGWTQQPIFDVYTFEREFGTPLNASTIQTIVDGINNEANEYTSGLVNGCIINILDEIPPNPINPDNGHFAVFCDDSIFGGRGGCWYNVPEKKIIRAYAKFDTSQGKYTIIQEILEQFNGGGEVIGDTEYEKRSFFRQPPGLPVPTILGSLDKTCGKINYGKYSRGFGSKDNEQPDQRDLSNKRLINP